jgi:DNA gyrase inhibitor GyrI
MNTTWQPTLMALAVILLIAGFALRLQASETAPYTVVQADGKYELRDYPRLTLVEASQSTNADSNFMRLFRFIRGGNQSGQKIAMTTPVFMDGSQTNSTMAFVMPAKLAKVPQPDDTGLVVKELGAGRFAVYRFRGLRNARNEAEALKQLEAWMQAKGLAAASPPSYAYFNPPWTPGFWRHNEVMIRVAGNK